MNGAGLPVVVVPAAGSGRRFTGTGHKLAQPLGQTTVLGHTLAQVVATGLPLVVVTTAPLAPVARSVVAARDIVLVPPDDAAGRERVGLGHSIAAGVSARAHAPGWVVLPGDMPLVTPATLRAVQRALREAPIAIAQHRGRRGHPIGFSQELFTELCGLSGDDSVRRLVTRYPGRDVEVDDDGVHCDIDTLDTLTAARERLEATLSGRPWAQPPPPG